MVPPCRLESDRTLPAALEQAGNIPGQAPNQPNDSHMDDQPDFDSPAEPSAPDAPLFQHPEWMVGIVLVCGGLAFVAGLADPVWWIIGSPAILALAVWAWGRIRSSRRDTEV